MRIVALGTGMPSPRPKQAAACWAGRARQRRQVPLRHRRRLPRAAGAQKIPYDYLDKVFFGHLHVDHMGDLPTFWLGGTTMNRLVPLRVWGPSGGTPELGTAHAMKLMEEMYAWDIGTRSGVIDFRGGELQVNEFPFDGVNEVIYDENGVVVRSIPAVHGLDGAVSVHPRVERASSSPTAAIRSPTSWWVKHTAGVDVAVHECFLPPPLLVTKPGLQFRIEALHGRDAGTHLAGAVRQDHVADQAAAGGRLPLLPTTSTSEPGDDRAGVRRDSTTGRSAWPPTTWSGNVTKDDIRVRMSVVDHEIWPSPPLRKKIPPDTAAVVPFSKFTISGAARVPGSGEADLRPDQRDVRDRRPASLQGVAGSPRWATSPMRTSAP